MGVLSKAVDWVLMRDLPAARIDRQQSAGMHQRAAMPRSISGSVPGWQSGKPTFPADNVLVLTRDGYRKTSTAFACINIIADAVAEATLRVWEDQGSGKREEILDHPLRQLMQHPNPQYSEAEFIAQTVRIAAIAGYSVIEKVRARGGNVVQLGHIRPDWIRPILRDQRAPDWEVTIPGERPEVLPADDAIVFRYMDSPLLEVTGDTPLRAVLREAGILNELTDFVKLLLERGGMPQIVLVVDSPKDDQTIDERLTDDEREAIRQQFIAKYSGYRNWVGPAIIDGMKVETVQLDLNQLAFKDLRDGLDLSVCQAFRVPAPLVQVQAGLTTSYGKLLEESMTLLQMYTASPLRNRLDGAFTRGLADEFGLGPAYDLGFDTSTVKALQEDENAAHERARADFEAGILTFDEARMRIGEEAWENAVGGSLKLPFSAIITPLDQVVPEQDPPEDDLDAEDVRFEIRSGRLYVNRRAQTPQQRAADAQIAAKAKQAMVQLAQVGAPIVRGFLDGQRDRVLTAIVGDGRAEPAWSRDVSPSTPDIEQRAVEAIDWMSEDEFLREVMRQFWELTGQTAFDDIGTILSTSIAWDLSNPHLQDLFDVLGRKITRINEETRQAVETVVRESLIEGTSIDELADSLRDLFDETYRNRHVTVARTESQIAYNLATQTAYQASGLVSRVQMHDGKDCEAKAGSDGLTCPQRDGLVVDVTAMQRHIDGEHPNGTLAFSPILDTPLGEV